jgi:plastocyanin
MNKRTITVIIIIAAVLAVGAAILLWRNAADQSGFAQQVKEAQSTLAADQSMDVKATISNFAFTPQIIKVKKGAKVTWTNQDDIPHTVTSDEGTLLNSNRLNKGDSYDKTFTDVGVYRYHCTPHPGMLGVVIVE